MSKPRACGYFKSVIVSATSVMHIIQLTRVRQTAETKTLRIREGPLFICKAFCNYIYNYLLTTYNLVPP